MKKHLSLRQRIHNAEGAQTAEMLHAWHSYTHGATHCKEEWAEIWSRSDDVSWAHSFGRWRGFQSVWWGSVARYNWRGIQAYEKLVDLIPEVSWLTDFRSLSECAMHTLATDIIEVADDGQTARGFFLTPGVLFCAPHENMKYSGGGLWERYGSDFIYEDGEWKYLHEQVCPDVGGSFDASNAGAEGYKNLLNPPPGPPRDMGGAGDDMRLQDPGPLHFSYTPIQTVQNTVPWPEPYKTMDNNNTYTKKL